MQLNDLRNWMTGEDCVVVGCGPSAQEVARDCPKGWEGDYAPHWTLACNRSVEFAQPDFAVCVEPARDPLWKLIRQHAPLIVFSHIWDNRYGVRPLSRMVKIGSKNVLDWLTPGHTNPAALTLAQCPFFATACAVLLGFETIGLIGVDMTNDETHTWPNVDRENLAYGRLADVASSMGSRISNLSPTSRLTSIPHGSWEEVNRKCQTLEKSRSPAP